MNEEIFFIRLRDCFNAGYQMPQFCIDNNIKNPLIIIDESHAVFAWEIYAQFKYDKRITPRFSLLNGKVGAINFNVVDSLTELNFEDISTLNFNQIDYIIVLATTRLSTNFQRILYLDQLTDYFISKTYCEIPLLHFLQRHPKIKLITTNFPPQPPINDAEFIKKFTSLADFLKNIRSEKVDASKTLLGQLGYTREEMVEISQAPEVITNLDGSTSMKDDTSPLVNVVNGKRSTAYQPATYKNKIYFFGICHDYGIHAPFDKTIASYLQKMLNDNNLPYRVENESQRLFGRVQDNFYNLSKSDPKPGDIIFYYGLNTPNIPFFNVSHAFDSYDYRKLWITHGHSNELGYKILAGNYFQFLVQNNFFQNTEFKYPAPPPPPHRYGIPKEFFGGNSNLSDNKDLQAYKEKLRGKRLNIGAIVMNCNPFTLGHKYLIEYAAARVNRLYIFVVEEDKSEFAFADRLELVKRGTKDFPNVEVIPSGKFIISQQTFSGYFNKSELQNVAVDSSEDVEIFAREIAPTLGINIRFAGEEPEDTVTRQYNDNMRNILPRYDINFVEIPRKEINGEVISAKSVRAALKVGDFDKLSKLVPKTTLDFLRKNYTTKTAPPPHANGVMTRFIGGVFIWLVLYSRCRTFYGENFFVRRCIYGKKNLRDVFSFGCNGFQRNICINAA